MSPGRLLKPQIAKRHAGPLVEPPPPIELTTAPGFDGWSKLDAKLAALGPHRLMIAAHAARAAASGGTCLPSREEEQIAAWFTSIVEEANRSGGSSMDDSDQTGAAIWHVLNGDWHRDSERVCSVRCFVVAEVPCRGTPGFLASLRAAAAHYVHTIVAGTSADDISELRSLLTTIDDGLEAYPLCGLVDAEDAPASEFLEPALANMTLRSPTSAEVCGGFSGWAQLRAARPRTHDPHGGPHRRDRVARARCAPRRRGTGVNTRARDRIAVLHGILGMLPGATATNFHGWKAWDWLRMTASPRHAGSLLTQRDGGQS